MDSISTKDLIIVRQTCIKAAAEIIAAQPSYNANGDTLNPEVELGFRTLALAQELEDWCWRATGAENLAALERAVVEAVIASGPVPAAPAPAQNGALVQAAKAQGAVPVASQPLAGFDVTKCPAHSAKTAKSKYQGWFCTNRECGWERKPFINNEGEPDEYTVTKVKWRGVWYDDEALVEALVADGVVTA